MRADAEREFKLQFQQKLEQERAQWSQYRDGMEREVAELRRRLTEGQEEENLENDMKKVWFAFWYVYIMILVPWTVKEMMHRHFLGIVTQSESHIILVLGLLSKLGFVSI